LTLVNDPRKVLIVRSRGPREKANRSLGDNEGTRFWELLRVPIPETTVRDSENQSIASHGGLAGLKHEALFDKQIE